MISEAVRVEQDEVSWSLGGPVRKILRGKRVLFTCMLIGVGLSVLLALAWRPYYEGQAVFLPPKNTDLIPTFGTGAGGGGAAALLLGGGDSSADIYLGMLGSRTVADDVIDRVGLMSIYKADGHDRARVQLARASTFSLRKNLLIYVQVKADTPALAEKITNAYLDALYRLNGKMVASASAHRAAFFEQQLDEQKTALVQSELALKTVQEQAGFVLPIGEAQAGVAATAQLQSQVGAAEATLSGLLISETEQNPDVVQARSLLNQLRGQLARQLADSEAGHPSAGIPSNRRLPQLTFDYMQKEREVKLREAVYGALVQQYERARLSSTDPGQQFQIVDRAIIPEHKAGPPRTLIVLGGFLLGTLGGFALLFFRDWRARSTAFSGERSPASPR